MRLRFLFLALGLLSTPVVFAQQPIRFGEQSVVLERNVQKVRGKSAKNSSLEFGTPVGDKVNVLVQFGAIPTTLVREQLQARGIELYGGVGSNAYWAGILPGLRASDLYGTGIEAVAKANPNWKLNAKIRNAAMPEFAEKGHGKFDMILYWQPNVALPLVQKTLSEFGVTYRGGDKLSRNIQFVGSLEQAARLAELPWVAYITHANPKMQATNLEGSMMSGGFLLRESPDVGGRYLTGQGVKVGLWDETVESHIDLENHVVVLEDEEKVDSNHGKHTSGTIAGAGILQEAARGVAPQTTLYTSNFGEQSNGLQPSAEMAEAKEKYGISLTSNSYGLPVRVICRYFMKEFSYNYSTENMNIDLLAEREDELTHVFSAGNDRGVCGMTYGTMGGRSKNVIYVGAVDKTGALAQFSSMGPMDDGRLAPTICAKGVDVYSTLAGNGYEPSNGTSMSCPMVTGHLSLLTERYHQLHNGANPKSQLLRALVANTADDLGNTGPDFEYGYGLLNANAALGVMEAEQYTLGELLAGGNEAKQKINVPAGCKQLRVMLVWNDPVGANKDYAWGEAVLKNDLDLKLTQGAQVYLPWVLDHKNPKALAQRKEDHLNNIEQVTIDNPSQGEYEVVVAGANKIVEGGKQPYAVVWYFDMQEPEILAPLAGQSFAPGEKIYLRTRNFAKTARVELSYDGGETFHYIGEGNPSGILAPIPDDAPITAKALLRILDKEGRIGHTQPFSIMTQVESAPDAVKVVASNSCNWAGLALSFWKIDGAEKYEILKADMKTGLFYKIGEMPQSTEFVISYTLKEADIDPYGRNVYSIRPVGVGGALGRRSRGVMPTVTNILKLKKQDLPFVEDFRKEPLEYVRVTHSQIFMYSGFITNATQIDKTAGKRSFIVKPQIEATDWTNPFASKNICRLNICQIDLTSIEPETKLVYEITHEFAHGKGAAINPEDAQMKLLVNKQELIPLGATKAEVLATGTIMKTAYDFSKFVGKPISIEIQLVAKSIELRQAIHSYAIKELKEDVDLRMWACEVPYSKENMGMEHVKVVAQNLSPVAIEEAKVVVNINGQKRGEKETGAWKPYEYKSFDFETDFTTQKPEGEKFDVSVSLECEKDKQLANNTYATSIYNLGKIYPHLQGAAAISSNGDVTFIDPQLTKEIEGEHVFTDHGGLLLGYEPWQRSTIRYKPKTAGKLIALEIQEWDLAFEDSLTVFTGDIVENLDFTSMNPKPTPAFVLRGKGTTPTAVLSTAADKGVVVFFHCGDSRGKGWKGVLKEVDAVANTVGILEVKPFEARYPDGNIPVTVNLKNYSALALDNVLVRAEVASLKYKAEKRVSLEANAELEVSFDEKIPAPYPTVGELKITVVAPDTDISDNQKVVPIQNDRFWYGATINMLDKWQIKRIRAALTEIDGYKNQSGVLYQQQETLPIYLQTTNYIEVELEGDIDAADLPASVHVWLDADPTDEGFKDEAPEHFSLPLVAAKKVYTLPIDLQGKGVKEGRQRIRIGVCKDADKEKILKGETVEFAAFVDHTAVILDKPCPVQKDLEVSELTSVASSQTLGASNPVTVKITNKGLDDVAQLQLKLYHNDELKATEDVTAMLPKLSGTLDYTFTQQLDFSALGEHKIRVEVEDGTQGANNKREIVVYHLSNQDQDKIYSIALHKPTNPQEAHEYIALPESATRYNSHMTLEGWFYIDEIEEATLFSAQEFGLFVAKDKAGYKDGALYLAFKNGGSVRTTTRVLWEKQWNHIAVEWYIRPTYVQVYIIVNGNEAPLSKRWVRWTTPPDLTAPRVGWEFNGRVKGVRTWARYVPYTEIRQNMYAAAPSNTTDLLLDMPLNEGKFDVVNAGNNEIAKIVTREAVQWNEEKEQFTEFKVEGQAQWPKKLDNGDYEVYMEEDFANWNNVKFSFTSVWPDRFSTEGVEYTLNGKVLDAGTGEIDLSAVPNHEVNVLVKQQPFGINPISRNFKIVLKNEASAACELLKFEIAKADNNGLTEDKEYTNPKATLVLLKSDLGDATLNTKQVKVKFTELSAGAKLRYKDQEVAAGESLVLDLSEVALLKVIAANGHSTKNYTLVIHEQQTIDWTSFSQEMVYSKETLQLQATATSKLPVLFVSKNPQIASVDTHGVLRVHKVGTTQIVAHQAGKGSILPAEPVMREFKVTPAPLTVQPKDIVISVADALPALQYEVNGFLDGEQVSDLPPFKYEIWDANGDLVDKTRDFERGEYTLRVKGISGEFLWSNYSITFAEAKLRVTGVPVNVTFTITDKATGAAIPDAQVKINTTTQASDANGKVVFSLEAGSECRYSITCDGYDSYTRNVTIKEGGMEIPVALTPNKGDLIFEVTEGSVPLAGVTIALEGQSEIQTDHQGSAKLRLPFGNYKYEAKKKGYESKKGDVAFDKTQTIKVQLKALPKDDNSNAIEDYVFAGLRVAPNPFEDVVRISLGETVVGMQYRMVNAQGVEVLRGELREAETLVYTADLKAGVYMLQLVLGESTKTIRVVKL